MKSPLYINLGISKKFLLKVDTFYITVKQLSKIAEMKRRKRSQNIRNKNASKNYTNNGSNKNDINTSDDNLPSSLTQKPMTTKKEEEEEGEAISEVFDSSTYKPGKESKELAAIIHEQDTENEEEEKKLPSVQKDESINPELVSSAKLPSADDDNTNNNTMNTNPSIANPVIIEEPTHIINRSKEEHEEKEKELAATAAAADLQYKNIKNEENYEEKNLNNNINNNTNSYMTDMASWQGSTMAWFDIYNEFARNATIMTKYWLNLFWNPWSKEQKNSNSGTS
jgi:hypothetical protein